ncbi:uncharacterized protein VP01_887g6 [Puccinia sorghi]|uniref:Uncharacterized protein n=1 Tax=Puccinia sorghi TaxID=27349 RepID=A0A0L6U895_9BASI|nr:uncharacterized protein VP01_887g6 [Puccinia sorghi]
MYTLPWILKEELSIFPFDMQSIFGWDQDHANPTSDFFMWDELIQVHPRCSFKLLRGKDFSWYYLAEEVFSGVVSGGSMAKTLFTAVFTPHLAPAQPASSILAPEPNSEDNFKERGKSRSQ